MLHAIFPPPPDQPPTPDPVATGPGRYRSIYVTVLGGQEQPEGRAPGAGIDQLEPALDQVKVAAATGSKAMADLSAWRQRRQVHTSVLVDSDHLAAFRPDHLQQPVRALIGGELPLLDLRREARSVGKNPQLQELHRFGLRPVLLRMLRA